MKARRAAEGDPGQTLVILELASYATCMWRSAKAPQGSARRAERKSLRLALTGFAVAVVLVAPQSDAAFVSARDDGMFRGSAPTIAAATLPNGFQEDIVFSGLTQPVAVRFASDGRIFVAEKSGVIKVFDNLSDTTPTEFANLSNRVHNYWDRGLLGLALHPQFPSQPYVYAL